MSKRSEDRTEFLKDLIITAVEGGIGYWSYVRKYDYKEGIVEVAAMDPEDWDGDEDTLDDPLEWKPVTLETLARGINLICSGTCNKYATKEKYVRFLREAHRENDAGMLDSGDADNILQAGLFGEVIYG